MAISDPGRGLVRRLGVTAAALLRSQRHHNAAEALSFASGAAPSSKICSRRFGDQVRHGGHGGGGGGLRGGGGGFLVAAAVVVFAAAGFMAVDSRRRCRVPWRRFRGGGVLRPSWRLSPRRFHGGGALGFATSITGHFTTGIAFTGGSTPAITDTRITMAIGIATAA
jgi:hypothetical protein